MAAFMECANLLHRGRHTFIGTSKLVVWESPYSAPIGGSARGGLGCGLGRLFLPVRIVIPVGDLSRLIKDQQADPTIS